jgi:hypothetical protein
MQIAQNGLLNEHGIFHGIVYGARHKNIVSVGFFSLIDN